MKRLSKKNILFVKERHFDGIPYNYFIATSNKVSENRCYFNCDSNGKSTTDYYAFERLPKCVQEFIQERYKAKDFFYTEEKIEMKDGAHTIGVYTFE